MPSDLSTALKTLAQSPGHLVYHLILCLTLLFSLFWTLIKINQGGKKKSASGLVIGSVILLILQMALFIISLLNAADIYQTSLTFAVVERLFAGLTVIWLVWTLQENKKPILFNNVLIFMSLVLILISIAAMLFIRLLPDTFMNSFQIYDITWQSTILLMILVGIIYNLIMKPKQWVTGLVLLILLILGYILQIIFAAEGDIHMGAFRLALILSMPFYVLFIIQRLGERDWISKQAIAQKEKEGLTSNIKPDLMNLLLTIPLEATPQGRIEAAIQAISLGVVADICYIVRILGDLDKLEIVAGYDLIQERFLPTPPLSPGDIPQITAAWKDHQVLQRSQAQLEDRDYETLIKLLNYFRTGYVLAVPLGLPGEPPVGGIIFLSPYTSKLWRQDTLSLIDTVKENLTRVLFASSPMEKFEAELEVLQGEKQRLLAEKTTLSQLLADKEIALDHQEKHIQQYHVQFQEERNETSQRIENLQGQIENLQAQLSSQSNTETLEQMQADIRQLTSENDQLQTLLSRANARIKDLEVQSGQTGPIRLSMQNQILSLDSVAANVKLQINPQLQQRHLKLEIVNPDGRQMIKTDPELVQNILFGLLENAIQVSEPGSAVQLNQRLSFETGMLILEVTDFGDGLTQEEQKAFFSADYTDIPGIGNIAAIRDAIRAIRVLNGKIWLRSKKWNFTTFRVQLPVRIID